jgi:2,4-dienoyl-CoA reductase-like NADH-dependent reductase (Old Yellow Enzyme family)
MTSNDPLLQPLRIKGLTLKNRIFSSAHIALMVDDHMPQDRYQAYHEEKAKGGIGLSMFGGSSTVSIDSPGFYAHIDVSHDRVIPHFRTFAARMHAHGAALMIQLSHLGRRTFYDQEPWLPLLAPSRVREPAHRAIPVAMDRFDIARVARDFGQAARRCREGDLDGCELIAYGHLIGQFLSPSTNQRNDAYGGSIENRMRFGMEVLEEVRRQVGDDYIVGLRLYGDERIAEGSDQNECVAIAERFALSGLVDFINVVASDISTQAGLADMMPGMSHPIGVYLPVAAAVKRVVKVPVLHATRIADLATARHAIEQGLVDLVGMTRAHIADPHIVAKLERGEVERIRPCVGAAYCSDNRANGIRCLHNAATGRETWLSHAIAASGSPRRRVVIVGAGPAGLEAARVSASRGHEVIVLEAAHQVGGQILLAARAGWRKDLIGIADWLAGEVEHLGAELRCNQLAQADDVLALAPDVVIVATGGLPDLDIVAGAEHVHSTWDVLAGTVPAHGRWLVFDDHGEHQAPSCAGFLAAQGAEVELVTSERCVAEASMRAVNVTAHLRELYGGGVTLTPDRRLIGVAPAGNRLRATLRNEYTGKTERREVDRVAVEHGTLPVDNLFHELREQASNLGLLDHEAMARGQQQDVALNPQGAFMLYRVGDAVASRNIHAAIYDSFRLCRHL